MRILATSDLHYNIKRSESSVRDVAKKVLDRGGDVLIIAGDIAGADSRLFGEALSLFSEFRGKKILVAGNHDLWVNNGDSSIDKWKTILPELAREADFCYLDESPVEVDGVGFFGNVGWYDYSFADESLVVPRRFYEAKVGPGRASRLSEYDHLIDEKEPLNSLHQEITISWKDGEYVKLPFSDEEFVELLMKKLESDIEQLRDAKKLVAVLHHLPRKELVWFRNDPNWDFAAAFLGSERFGEFLSSLPNLKLCLSGHNHRADSFSEGEKEFVSIGSTYLEKVLLEFDI